MIYKKPMDGLSENGNGDNGPASALAGVLRRPVVIIGLMGAGKSSIGRLLACELGLEFFDSDREIEADAGLSVPEIFERDGEAAFRAAEKRTIARILSGGGPLVLATGGGAVMNPETAGLVCSKAVSIWLRADIDLLVKRTGESSGRPLLDGADRSETLRNLAKQRYPVYEKADIVVDSLDVPCQATLNEVIGKLYEHICHKG